MTLDCLRSRSFLGEQFYRRAEEVMKESPLLCVKAIQKINHPGIIKPVVSDPLPHMGPVLLLYMGIVVFMIGTAAGKGNRPSSFRKIPVEVVIEKLGTVIAVKTEDGKRQLLFNIPDLCKNPRFSLSPYGPLLRSAGGNVDEINGEGKHACHRFSTVGNRISFEIPRM